MPPPHTSPRRSTTCSAPHPPSPPPPTPADTDHPTRDHSTGTFRNHGLRRGRRLARGGRGCDLPVLRVLLRRCSCPCCSTCSCPRRAHALHAAQTIDCFINCNHGVCRSRRLGGAAHDITRPSVEAALVRLLLGAPALARMARAAFEAGGEFFIEHPAQRRYVDGERAFWMAQGRLARRRLTRAVGARARHGRGAHAINFAQCALGGLF